MHIALLALLVGPLLQAPAAPAPPDLKSGAALRKSKFCANCHGEEGEGGFGPDLAGGRGLTLEQFRYTIRHPWGIMLSFTEQQLPDQKIADIYAFIQTKPKVAQPGEWHWAQVPATAPASQKYYMNAGCAQCHEPENKFVRMWLGEHAKEVNFDYFAKLIYNHTDKYPNGGMGNFSRERLPEIVLREIYKFHVEDLGMRASVGGSITIGEQKNGATQYDMTVTNRGVKDVGLDVDDMTVFVRIPSGTKVLAGTGPGYKGVQSMATLGLQPALAIATHADKNGKIVRPPADMSGDAIVWKISKLSAGEKVPLSFTIAGQPTPELIKAFDGSAMHWDKPGRNEFGSKLEYRDTRTPDKGDHERIGLPRLPAPGAQQ